MTEYEVDLEGIEEQELESGGNLELPGWYTAILDDVVEDNKEPSLLIFKFKAVEGPTAGSHAYQGCGVQDRLWPPSLAKDAEKAKTAARRVGIFAKRLGLLASSDFGKRVTVDWTDAIGKMVAIKVSKSKPNDEGKTFINLEWAGIFNLDHERCPDWIKKQAGGDNGTAGGGGNDSPSGGKPGGSAGKPKFNYDDV